MGTHMKPRKSNTWRKAVSTCGEKTDTVSATPRVAKNPNYDLQDANYLEKPPLGTQPHDVWLFSLFHWHDDNKKESNSIALLSGNHFYEVGEIDATQTPCDATFGCWGLGRILG